MKRIFTILLFFVPLLGLKAQIQLEDTTNMTVAGWRNICFGLLDKSTAQIPSGYLLEYSLSPFQSDRYDGVGADTIRSYNDFLYVYNLLELSAVNANAALTGTDDLYITAHRRKRSGAIPFMFLFQKYQTIDPSALANNLVAVSPDQQRLSDVPGRPSSPYLTKETFAFAPFQADISSSDDISFTFPAELWQMPGITQVTIDFGDGSGNRTINKGDSLAVYYANSGRKYITATITTTGGTRTAKSAINYTRPQNYFKADLSVNLSVAPVYTDVNDYLGISAFGIQSVCNTGNIFTEADCDIEPGASVRVVLGCDRVFDRPVIIVSGFDMNNEVTLEGHVASFDRYDFIGNMTGIGQDLVFVTFTKPTDFVENNAKVLEAVINWVNANKTGSNDGAVIGFSMGGLVARWCLRDMEDRSIDHNIAHYFSYDAPHQGANVPLGIQYILQEVERDFPYLKWNWPWPWNEYSIEKSFDPPPHPRASPAARQMLVTKAVYNGSNPGLSTLDPLRAAFAGRLAAKGYPQNAVSHGISFGRGDNTAATRDAGTGAQFGNFGPGSRILDANVKLSLINLELAAYAVPEGTTGYITRYRFSGLSVRRLFPLFPPFIIPVLNVRNVKLTGVNPYDDAPGSYEASQSIFVSSIPYVDMFGLHSLASNNGHHGHNFIPTVSALDLTNQGYSTLNNWQSNNMFFNIDNFIQNPGTITGNTLSNTALSPFDFVQTYTSDCGVIACQSLNDNLNGDEFTGDIRNDNWNQYHNGWISRQASRYIYRKILNAEPPVNCAALCDVSNNVTDIGPDCDNRFLFLQNAPNGFTYVWENLTPALITIVGGQNTPWIDVVRAGATMGTASVRVTVTGPCGVSKVITHSFQIGAPVPSFTRLDSDHQKMYITVTPMPGATGYNYFIDGVQRRTNVGNSITYPNGSCDVHIIGVQVIYPCGLSAIVEGEIELFCLAFRVSPNPAKGFITVTPIAEMPPAETNAKMSTQTEAPALKPITELRLYDTQSRLVKMQKGGNGTGSVNLETEGLIPGMYLLEIYSGKEKQVRKVMIVR